MPQRPGFYFAYGSNLHPERLGRRTPSQRLVGVTELPGYELRFHKRSGKDDSAKCDAYHTGDAAQRILGVIYALEPEDFPALDRAEGLGAGYDLRIRPMSIRGETRDAFFYVAQEAYIDPTSRPFAWYRDLVLHGALYHAFPEGYVQRIRQVQGVPDPDAARSARHDEILRAMVTV